MATKRNKTKQKEREQTPLVDETPAPVQPTPVQKQPQPTKTDWDDVYVPSFTVVFRFMLVCRLLSAATNIIHDCDETFNYWEPLHHFLFGYGLQTWEYSPVYSIRSYAYVLIYGILAELAKLIYPSKIHIFYAVRIVFATWCSFCEAKLYEAVVAKDRPTGLILLFLMSICTGMFVSSTSFLPSSFGMTWVALAVASWLNLTNQVEARKSHITSPLTSINFPISIACIGVAVLVGWPFCGAMGIPIAIDYLILRRQFARFFTTTMLVLFGILAPVMVIDYYYYGKVVIVPLQIVAYNVLSGAAGRGPDLYGTEPWTYYMINGFLNLNVAFPLALISLPLVVIVRPFKVTSSLVLQLIGPYLWLAIFIAQPHKEERFLYVIYPLLLWQAAISLRCIWALLENLFSSFAWWGQYLPITSVLMLCSIFMLLSLSRTSALLVHYSGSLETWRSLSSSLPPATPSISNASRTICVGKEWYRFPSHFFVPEPYRIAFIKSDFRGLLPKYYEGSGRESTSLIPTGFNDLNQEDPSRYVDLGVDCGYVIDLCLDRPDEKCIHHSNLFHQVYCYDFIDAERSPSWTRAFYIPYYSGALNAHASYCLYQKKPPQNKSGKKRQENPKEEKKETKKNGLFQNVELLNQRVNSLLENEQYEHAVKDNLKLNFDKPEDLLTSNIFSLLLKPASVFKILRGHKSTVHSVAFSTDNKLLASASNDGTVLLWNIPNGDLIGELGHTSDVYSVSFSPDGKSIVTGNGDDTVRTWSVATKQQVKTLTGHSHDVRSVAWSPNGALIASGSNDETVILWDAISGSVKKTLTGHTSWVYSVLFSQNGNKLASAGYADSTAIIWVGCKFWCCSHRIGSLFLVLVCLFFSHDDQFVVSGCGDNIVRMFDANNGHEEKRFEGHTDAVYSVACSFDGSIIVSCSYDKSVRLWDVASTKQLQQLDAHTETVNSVSFSRDGKFIASASDDKTVRLWNAPSLLKIASEPQEQEQKEES